MRLLWHIITSTTTTFWLLLTTAVFLFLGVLYTNEYFDFYISLDYSSILQWLRYNLINNFYSIWWIGGLLITISFIILNTLFCTINTLCKIVKNNIVLSKQQLIGKYCIAIIHILTIGIITAHAISLQFSKTYIYSIKEGENIIVSSNEKLFVKKIAITYFYDKSILKNYIKDITITLLDTVKSNKEIIISPLRPISYGKYTLFLTMNKNKSIQKYFNTIHYATTNYASYEFYLVVKKDYGYTLWLLLFICVACLFIFYFAYIIER